MAIFIAPKATLKVTPIAIPEATQKTRSSIVVLNISPIVALKVAPKPALKLKSIRALKSRIVAKPKLAGVTKYKGKTTKLYTSYIYSAKALTIRSR